MLRRERQMIANQLKHEKEWYIWKEALSDREAFMLRLLTGGMEDRL